MLVAISILEIGLIEDSDESGKYDGRGGEVAEGGREETTREGTGNSSREPLVAVEVAGVEK